MKRWEYKIIEDIETSKGFDRIREEDLNNLGIEGWELVSATSAKPFSGQIRTKYVFKREISHK